METKTQNIVEIQGTETKTKKQAISKTYTLTQFKEMIRKLKETNLITEEEKIKLENIRQNAVKKYVEQM